MTFNLGYTCMVTIQLLCPLHLLYLLYLQPLVTSSSHSQHCQSIFMVTVELSGWKYCILHQYAYFTNGFQMQIWWILDASTFGDPPWIWTIFYHSLKEFYFKLGDVCVWSAFVSKKLWNEDVNWRYTGHSFTSHSIFLEKLIYLVYMYVDIMEHGWYGSA